MSSYFRVLTFGFLFLVFNQQVYAERIKDLANVADGRGCAQRRKGIATSPSSLSVNLAKENQNKTA